MLTPILVAMTLAAEPTPTAMPSYSPAQGIADALSGPLVPILGDTGFGPNEKLPDCFYRNERVIVINRYCSKREINTTGIQIMHPEKGVLYFYAEARAPISSITREDYEQWRIEARDPPPGLRVDEPMPEIQKHLRQAPGVCWTGFGSPGGVPTGCHYKTPEVKQAWMDGHDALLKTVPPGWYDLVRELRGFLGKKPPPLKVPAVAAAGVGATRIVVHVFEYSAQIPVVGARVILRGPTGTEERTGITGKDGRVAVQAPSADFGPVRVELEGLIPPEELRPIWSAFQTLDPDRYPQGKDEVRWEVPVVRRAWLEANMKVRTREQADAVAADWSSDCGPNERPSAVEFREGRWFYTFSCIAMNVDPWTGKGGGRKLQPEPPSATPLYAPAEALADAVSGPLTHVGTTIWYGRFGISSCIYRNEKVFVINSYCTQKELNQNTVIVIHPALGVVHFKARGQGGKPVSPLQRAEYSEWGISSTDGQHGLTLAASADALVAWEERRHRFYRTPGCGAGQSDPKGKMGFKCSEKTPDFDAWWKAATPPLLEAPPASWYALLKDLRERARKDGRKDPRLAKGDPE